MLIDLFWNKDHRKRKHWFQLQLFSQPPFLHTILAVHYCNIIISKEKLCSHTIELVLPAVPLPSSLVVIIKYHRPPHEFAVWSEWLHCRLMNRACFRVVKLVGQGAGAWQQSMAGSMFVIGCKEVTCSVSSDVVKQEGKRMFTVFFLSNS